MAIMVAGVWFMVVMNTIVLLSHNTLLLVVCADVQRLEDSCVRVHVGVRALLLHALALLQRCPKLFLALRLGCRPDATSVLVQQVPETGTDFHDVSL